MNRLQEAIKEYSERGFNLIPLAYNSKEPLKGFDLNRYFAEKYPAQALIDLAEFGDINIGVMAGKTSGISVIDVDRNNEQKYREYLSEYPTDMIEKSPHGWHLYYEAMPNLPEGMHIDGGEYWNGKRYLVIAPSKFEGQQYEWLKKGELGKLPYTAFQKPVYDIQTGKYKRQEILDMLDYAVKNGKFMDGQRNDSIIYIATVLAGDGWGKETIFNLLYPINRRGDHPDSEKAVRGMVDRGFDYAQNNKYDKNKPLQKGEHNVELAISSYGAVAEKYADYEASWLVDGWLLKSSILTLAAPPERYKTWLAVDLALSIASGLPFLDAYAVHETGNVLIFQQEDYGARYFARFNTVERAKLERAHLPVTLEEDENGTTVFISSYNISNKIFFHENAEFTLDNDLAIDRLKERVIQTNAVLCIIDPFYSLSSADDYFASTAAKIRSRIKEIRNETGCAFLFVHHTRKTGGGDTGDSFNQNQIFGSQFVNAVMEGRWIAGRTQGMSNTQITVIRNFKDENAQPATKITFHINMKSESDSDAYWLDVEDVSEDLLNTVIAFLRENGATTHTEIFEVFGDKFASKATLSRWLGQQSTRGIQKQDGKRGKYFVDPDAIS